MTQLRSFAAASAAIASVMVGGYAQPGLAQVQPVTPSPWVVPTEPMLAPVAPMTPAPVFNSNDYTLGAGDRINLELFEVPEYSGEYQVLTDGTLTLPRIGTVPVRGLTLEQAAAEISSRYRRYLRRPVATLTLLQPGALNVVIAGQINRPGTYAVAPEEVRGTPTLTRVIQLAGGITQSADIRQVQIRRVVPQNPTESQTIEVDLWELLRTGDLGQDIVLRDGDSVLIPTATALTAAESTALASASFSPEVMTVNVVGEVGQPGAIAVPPNTPLNQAVLAAGGFNNRARRNSVQLIRLNPDGTVARRDIQVDLAQGANPETNPTLRNQDTIVVSRSGLASFADTAGTILSPLGGIFNLFRILGF